MTRWEVIFLQLVAWRLHPGYLRPGCEPPSVEQLRELADQVDAICAAREVW